jgi:RES domain-containing protein
MEAFRLAREKHSSVLSGMGAAIKGARWNSMGVELIYTASNRSLAMAEVAVHFTLATLPNDYMMMTIYIPDNISFGRVNQRELPTDWNVFPHPKSTQEIGNKCIRDNKYCLLQIPSVVTPGDFNLLINPYHAEFPTLKIVSVDKFPFANRIFN